MEDKNKLSHINEEGRPAMVDVSDKNVTSRQATAQSTVYVGEEIFGMLEDGEIHSRKGPVLDTAVIAGTMGVKKTSELIPFCHPLPVEKIDIDIQPQEPASFVVTCTVKVSGKTGVEMEAITGASVTAMTIYDMMKGLSHDITIQEVKLLEKTGGKADYKRN